MHEITHRLHTLPGDVPSDEEIARRVLRGEPELFELLMRRHNQRLYRCVRPLLRDEAEVEDVMQQTYVMAFQRLGQFAGRSRLGTWLARIAVHEALGRLRRARRKPWLELEPHAEPTQAPASDPREMAANRELAGLLERAIDALPALYRQVFVLREVEGMNTADAAVALAVSEDVVKTRLVRARSMLHRRLAAVAKAELGSLFPFRATRCDRVVRLVLALLRAARG